MVWHQPVRLPDKRRCCRPSAQPTGFSGPESVEAWLHFDYAGQRFSINNQNDEYWFFVDDPRCPESLLDFVLKNFAKLLGG